ncbi:RNA polymerase sigma factor [Singulisphaera sp. PoT]|uniref:RNA polymerase sigma factor n=1 Tax=Singulisphaera sp. PoT TaxID=3411797 RepID=UPI003BF4D129
MGRLFDEHGPALVLYARQWCDTPEDVVQDAFVKLARQRLSPDRVVPWLFRVVRNTAINASRDRRRRQKHEASSPAGDRAWFTSDDERIDALDASRSLAELDLETREVIVARFWGGLKFEEIAKLQNCSVTTAHRRYQAGLARLNERLERQWIQQAPAPSER